MTNNKGNNGEEPSVTKDSKRKRQGTQDTFEDEFANPSPQAKNGCASSFGRGIINDFKQTVGTHWVGEMINFNQKTLAVSFFLFFAAIVSYIFIWS